MRHFTGHNPSHCTTALHQQSLGEPPVLTSCISSLVGLIPAALRTPPAATLPSRRIPPPACTIRGAFLLCTPVPALLKSSRSISLGRLTSPSRAGEAASKEFDLLLFSDEGQDWVSAWQSDCYPPSALIFESLNTLSVTSRT